MPCHVILSRHYAYADAIILLLIRHFSPLIATPVIAAADITLMLSLLMLCWLIFSILIAEAFDYHFRH